MNFVDNILQQSFSQIQNIPGGNMNNNFNFNGNNTNPFREFNTNTNRVDSNIFMTGNDNSRSTNNIRVNRGFDFSNFFNLNNNANSHPRTNNIDFNFNNNNAGSINFESENNENNDELNQELDYNLRYINYQKRNQILKNMIKSRFNDYITSDNKGQFE